MNMTDRDQLLAERNAWREQAVELETKVEVLREALLSSKASLLLCFSSALVGNVPDEKNIKRSIAFIETTLAGKEDV